jgi:hypothetical protein
MKLLSAHYAEISSELFSEEQQRRRRERVAAEAAIVRLGRASKPPKATSI